jgi:hypothetical protein
MAAQRAQKSKTTVRVDGDPQAIQFEVFLVFKVDSVLDDYQVKIFGTQSILENTDCRRNRTVTAISLFLNPTVIPPVFGIGL